MKRPAPAGTTADPAGATNDLSGFVDWGVYPPGYLDQLDAEDAQR